MGPFRSRGEVLHLFKGLAMKRLVLPVIVLGLVACVDFKADRRVLATDVDIGPTPLVLEPATPLRAIGPVNELCAELPAEYRFDQMPKAIEGGQVVRPDGKLVHLSVAMIGPSGQRDSFPSVGIKVRQGLAACFESKPARDLERRYVKVELRADDTLPVMRLVWKAGKRYSAM
jgi:hypothetical protein